MIAAPTTRPIRNCVSDTVITTSPIACSPTSSAIKGLMKPSTIAVTMAVNAVPMTTATAKSMTFPRNKNSLNSLIIT